MSAPLVVIGTGLAGYMFAKEWRKHDTETPLTIVTRDAGDFYSKPMLSNALFRKKTAADLATQSTHEMATQLNATLITEIDVVAIDPDNKQITLADDRQIDYATLILATGAQPIMPHLTGDTDLLWQVNNLGDYAQFRQAVEKTKSILILGSGLIGCEFANDLTHLNHSIQVLSMDSAPLNSLVPLEVGQALQKTFAQAGIEWHFNETAKHIEKSGSGITLTTNSGSSYHADMILSAIGIKPDLTLATKAKLSTNRGIVVDNYLKTSADHVYALGDNIEFNGQVLPFISPLMLCARTLAKNLGKPDSAEPIVYPAMPVTVKTPLYPVSAAPPAQNSGKWTTETDGESLVAKHINDQGKLTGFAIGNGTAKQKLELTKQLN